MTLLKFILLYMKRMMEKLDEYRLERRLSQAQLGEILGVSVVTVNRWLNNHARPNKIQAFHIEKLLKSGEKLK